MIFALFKVLLLSVSQMAPAGCQPDAYFKNDKEAHNILICLSG